MRNARTTLETFHMDRQTYDTDAAALQDLEPALARGAQPGGHRHRHDVHGLVDSRATDGGGTYTIALDATGNVTRTSAPTKARAAAAPPPTRRATCW